MGKTSYFLDLYVSRSKMVQDTSKVRPTSNDYKKLHMRFRLTPTSTTSDDLELLSRNFVRFRRFGRQ